MGRPARIVSWVALGAVIAHEAVVAARSLSGTLHVRGLVAGVLISLAVVVTLRLLFRRECDLLRAEPALLAPLAALTAYEYGVLPLLAALVPGFGSVTSLSLGGMALGLSVHLLGTVAACLVYAAWMTHLVVRAVEGEPDRGPGLPGVVAALTAVGWCVPFLGMALVLAALPAVGMAVSIAVIALGSLVWNLGTAAWLVGAEAHDRDFGEAVLHGWRESWRGLRAFGLHVHAQLVLVGWFTFVVVRYSPAPGSTTSRTSWHVNATWTGAYPHRCDWYTDYMNALEHEQLGLVVVLLQLVLGVLAIAVRARVARHVLAGPSHPPAA